MGKTAIIGSGESVLAFQAGGVEAFPVQGEKQAKETLRRLAKTHSVIFLTDELSYPLKDLIDRMNESPYPIVISVPSANGTSDFAVQRMKEQMERALGVDILFQREER